MKNNHVHRVHRHAHYHGMAELWFALFAFFVAGVIGWFMVQVNL